MAVAAEVNESGPSDRAIRVRRWSAAAMGVAVPALIYWVLAVVFYWPISPFDTRHVVGSCACGDAVQQVWFLKWAAYAIGHGHDPLFSTYMNAPSGVNLAVNTSMPLLGILGWPVMALSNPVAAFNFLLRVGLALSALSMYLVLRGYVRSRAAAFVGGLLFGFSPYMLAEGQLHVFLVFLPLLPPLIPLFDRWLIRADGRPYRWGALSGVLVGLEVLISAEMAAVFLIFAVIALVPLALRYRGLVRSRLPLLLRGLGAAIAAGVVVGGYVPWMLLAGKQRPVGPPHTVGNLDSYHADLLSPIVPSRPQLLRLPVLHDVGDQFVRGIVHENGFYLGIPLLALVTVGAVRMRRSPLVLSFATLGIGSFVLGLGTHLTMANHVTPVGLPLAAITRVPLLQEIGPTRFALSLQMAAAVLLALLLDRVLQSGKLSRRRGAVVLAGLSLVALVPLLPNGFVHSSRARIPSYFSTGTVAEIPDGSTVLAYPYPYYPANDPMLWQAASDMRFRIVGGEIYVPSPTQSFRSTDYPHGELPRRLWAVLRGTGTAGSGQSDPQRWRRPSPRQRARLVADLRGYVASHPIDAMIVLKRGAHGSWVAALAAIAFGPPTTTHGNVLIWLRPTSG